MRPVADRSSSSNSDTLGGDGLDRLCWVFATHFVDFDLRLRLGHPDEGHETGYAAGMRNAYEDALQQFEIEGVDTLDRAEAYAKARNVTVAPVWASDFEDEMDGCDYTDVGLWRRENPGIPHYSSVPQDGNWEVVR